jgi:hypothetical protein
VGHVGDPGVTYSPGDTRFAASNLAMVDRFFNAEVLSASAPREIFKPKNFRIIKKSQA